MGRLFLCQAAIGLAVTVTVFCVGFGLGRLDNEPYTGRLTYATKLAQCITQRAELRKNTYLHTDTHMPLQIAHKRNELQQKLLDNLVAQWEELEEENTILTEVRDELKFDREMKLLNITILYRVEPLVKTVEEWEAELKRLGAEIQFCESNITVIQAG
eukprot:TRINITY_DN71607_c0_g1_i1.p1 TRINITY_DN71607_c0_g1~~TRINITY_DN71607_c0_g1_i1.p1  ORF type:complete len:158 (-),score=19.21 TRINITY_DN71607_c0_g1_i1:22-495(-)